MCADFQNTFTPRFQKHFKGLTAQEKKQLKNKLELLAQNPSPPSLRTRRIQGTTDLSIIEQPALSAVHSHSQESSRLIPFLIHKTYCNIACPGANVHHFTTTTDYRRQRTFTVLRMTIQ